MCIRCRISTIYMLASGVPTKRSKGNPLSISRKFGAVGLLLDHIPKIYEVEIRRLTEAMPEDRKYIPHLFKGVGTSKPYHFFNDQIMYHWY